MRKFDLLTSKSSILTMNSTDEPTSLSEGEFPLIENFLSSEGSLTTREGCTKLTTTPLTTPIQAFGTFTTLSGTELYVAVSNRSLYAGSSFPLSLISSSIFTSTSPLQLLTYRGYVLINDPEKGTLAYDGSNVSWCGVPSPRTYRTIETFESTSGWSTISGSGTNTLIPYNVTQGRYSLKMQTSSGTYWNQAKMFSSPLDLTTFPSAPDGDGTSSFTYDYIRLVLTRSSASLFNFCSLYLYTSSDRSSYFSAELSSAPQWYSTSASGVTFDIAIRKSAFSSTGSPSWSTIWGIGFDINPTPSSTPYIICDWCRLEKSGPIAKELSKTIAEFEADETWTGAPTSPSFSTTYVKSLSRSIVITGATTVSRNVTLNLVYFDEGIESSSFDSIELWVAKDTGVSPTDTLTLRLKTDTSNYFYYTFNASDIKTPGITAGLYKKLTSPSAVFTRFSAQKANFSGVGTPYWTNITVVELTTTGSGAFYVDSIKLVKTRSKRVIALIEPSASNETITISDTDTQKKSGWNDLDHAGDIDKIRTDEGSRASYSLKIAANTTVNFDIAFTSFVNCSIYPDGSFVQDRDLIGLWLWISNTKWVDSIDILFGDSNLNSYYIHTIPKDSLPKIEKGWFDAHFQRNEYGTVGSPSWSSISKMRVSIVTGKNGVEVCLDQATVTSFSDYYGNYFYRVYYVNERGARSEPSNISNSVDANGAQVYLYNLPATSNCTRVVERIGGTSSEWEKVGEVADDSTTTFIDSMKEEFGVTSLLNIGKPWKAKCFTLYKDVLIFGNLTDPDGIQHSSMIMTTLEYSLDEVNYDTTFDLGRDDGYELLSLIPSFDRVCALREQGIFLFDPYNLSQSPVLVSSDLGVAGTFSIAPYSGGFAFITPTAEIYHYDGASFTNIGHPIQSYLEDLSSTELSQIIGIYHDNYLFFTLPTYTTLCYYLPSQTWTIITGWSPVYWWRQYKASGAYLSFASSSGHIYRAFSGDTDDGEVIESALYTPPRFADTTLRSHPSTVFLSAHSVSSSSPASLTITPLLDEKDTGHTMTLSTIPSTLTRYELTPPDSLYAATYHSLHLNARNRLTLNLLSLTLREEEVAK